ncbi:MAG: RidA family protein [Nitrospirota bacterium]
MQRKIINTNDAPKAIGPYSQAVEVGGFIFLSGQIPIDPKTGSLMQGDIQSQSKLILDNAAAVLSAAGSSMSQVVKTTIYLMNMNDFSLVNEVYGTYFPVDPPARSTVEVARLPKDAAIEMDFIAGKG